MRMTMPRMAYKVALMAGSLRKDGYTARLAEALRALSPATLAFADIPIAGLPLYTPDLEPDLPPGLATPCSILPVSATTAPSRAPPAAGPTRSPACRQLPSTGR